MKLWLSLIQLLIVLGICWWLATHLPWTEAWRLCCNASPLVLILVFVQRFTPYAGLGYRLTQLFSGNVSFALGLQSSLLCVGCNSVIPARLGEIVKIVWLAQHGSINYPTICGMVGLERLLDVTTLFLLGLIFAADLLQPVLTVVLALSVVIAWGLAILLSRRPGLKERVPLPQCLRPFVMELLSALAHALHGNILWRTITGTLCIWSLNFLHVVLLANGLMELGLSLQGLGLLMVAMFFASGLMLSPGGLGTLEAAVVLTLGQLGVEMTQATALAIFARFFYSLPPLIGAALVLMYQGSSTLSIRRLLLHKEGLKECN